jgi:cytochrome bd ubiquinol oxidase subunit II
MQNPVWLGFFDTIFCVSSMLLAIFFGAALGNVVRGVPLGKPTDISSSRCGPTSGTRVGAQTGILDWYTVLTGVIALVTLTAHGCVVRRCENRGDLNQRVRTVALWAWPVQLVLTIVGSDCDVATSGPSGSRQLQTPRHRIPDSRGCIWQSLAVMIYAIRKHADKIAFVGSALYIVGMLVGAAFALYPAVLPSSSTIPRYNLTIYNTAAGHHGLTVGLTWWIIGLVLALGYFTFLFRMFRGKVRLEGEGY